MSNNFLKNRVTQVTRVTRMIKAARVTKVGSRDASASKKHIFKWRLLPGHINCVSKQVNDFGRIILSPTLAKVGLHQPDSRGSKTLHAPQTKTKHCNDQQTIFVIVLLGDHSN